MRAFAFALLLVLAGCTESKPSPPWLPLDETLTLDAIDAYVEQERDTWMEEVDSLTIEAYHVSLHGWYHTTVSQDTTAARAAYEEARVLGHPFAALNLARLELGTAWQTDFSQEASLTWLRTMRSYAQEGDSVTTVLYADRLAALRAEDAAGNADAGTVLAAWEAYLDGAEDTEDVSEIGT
ncbi:MAG: hypothetical protein AAF809_14065 [Bacteroidota bacterium]